MRRQDGRRRAPLDQGGRRGVGGERGMGRRIRGCLTLPVQWLRGSCRRRGASSPGRRGLPPGDAAAAPLAGEVAPRPASPTSYPGCPLDIEERERGEGSCVREWGERGRWRRTYLAGICAAAAVLRRSPRAGGVRGRERARVRERWEAAPRMVSG
jgi:hypothetical protein